MGKIVAIGGVTPPSTLDLIDKEIIKLAEKKNPKVLYVPTAGGDNLDYCKFFKGIYEGQFECKVDILFLVRETPTIEEVREKVFSADIIYIDGGSISRLMNYFKKFNMNNFLKEAYEKDIVLAGKSAGGLCFGKYYYENDNTEDFKTPEFNNYIEVDCLSFLNFIICPHYNLTGYSEKLEAMLKGRDVVGIALENNCAIEIIDEEYRIISSQDDANGYIVTENGTNIMKKVIMKDKKIRSINELTNIDIRYAKKEDADSFSLIYSKSYQTAFQGIIPQNILENVFSIEKRREGFLKEISEGSPNNVIMFDKDKLVGILTYGKPKGDNLDDSFVEIWRIFIIPDYWGKGMGKKLMDWALVELFQKNYKNISLWVIEDNLRARSFYESLGYYHDGTTRIINVGKELKDLRYVKHL